MRTVALASVFFAAGIVHQHFLHRRCSVATAELLPPPCGDIIIVFCAHSRSKVHTMQLRCLSSTSRLSTSLLPSENDAPLASILVL